MAVKPAPEGYHSLTPYLNVRNATRAIEFYKMVFRAVEKLRLDMPGGQVAHAELQIGDSVLMLADESPEWNNRSPETVGGTATGVMVYVDDADTIFNRAIEHGAKEISPMVNQFYGDRSGQIEDPFGHRWTIATQVEIVSEEEMQRRMAELNLAQG